MNDTLKQRQEAHKARRHQGDQHEKERTQENNQPKRLAAPPETGTNQEPKSSDRSRNRNKAGNQRKTNEKEDSPSPMSERRHSERRHQESPSFHRQRLISGTNRTNEDQREKGQPRLSAYHQPTNGERAPHKAAPSIVAKAIKAAARQRDQSKPTKINGNTGSSAPACTTSSDGETAPPKRHHQEPSAPEKQRIVGRTKWSEQRPEEGTEGRRNRQADQQRTTEHCDAEEVGRRRSHARGTRGKKCGAATSVHTDVNDKYST
jgi:hypothetical protein